MNELEYRYFLNASNVFTLDKQVKLLQTFKSAKTIFEKPDECKRIIGEEKYQSLINISRRLHSNKSFEQLQESGVRFLLSEDPHFPKSLLHVQSPPHLLYVKGELKIANTPRIAIIGTRNADLYGRSQAMRFAAVLADAGIEIISGLARGIDSIALNEAIKHKGSVIGVLGTGIDVVYPSDNENLFKKMIVNGAIISEFSPGSKPMGHHFPWRNRLISGLGSGLLVVQAGLKSGTGITVKWALEQGKDIFAIPGPINNNNSKGANMMIRDGAFLTQSPEEIIEFYESHIQNNDTGTNIEAPKPVLNEEKKVEKIMPPAIPPELLKLGLSAQAESIEEIMAKADMEYSILTRKINFEIAKGRVERLPGGRYRVKDL